LLHLVYKSCVKDIYVSLSSLIDTCDFIVTNSMFKILRSLDPSKIPLLDINTKMGPTDYIDFIRTEDMVEDLMRGYDAYGRSFLAIKLEYQHKRTTKQVVCTLFQRYTSANSCIAIGTCYEHQCVQRFLGNNSYLPDDEIEPMLKKLHSIADAEMLHINEDTSYVMPKRRRKLREIVSDVFYADIVFMVMQYL